MKNINVKEAMALLGASILLVGTLGLSAGCSNNNLKKPTAKNSNSVTKIAREKVTKEEIQQLKDEYTKFLPNGIYFNKLTEQDFDKIIRVIKMDETMKSDPLYYTYLYIVESLIEAQYNSQGEPSTVWYRVQDSDENYNLVLNEIYQPLVEKNRTLGPKVYKLSQQQIGESVKSDVTFMLSYPLSFWLDPRKNVEEKKMRNDIYNKMQEYASLSEKELKNVSQTSLSK